MMLLQFKRPNKITKGFLCYLIIVSNTLFCALTYAHPDIVSRIKEINLELRKHGESAELLSRRGNLYLEHNQLDLALRDFTKALQAEENYWKAIHGKVRVYAAKKRINEAILLLKSLDFCSNKRDCLTESLYLRAKLLCETNQNKAALEALEILNREIEDPDPSFFLWRADLLEKSGDLSLALEAILIGLRKHPKVPALVDRALYLEERLGQLDQAIVTLDSLLVDNQRRDLILLRKSELLARNGRNQESIFWAKQGLEDLKLLPSAIQERKEVILESEKLRKLINP